MACFVSLAFSDKYDCNIQQKTWCIAHSCLAGRTTTRVPTTPIAPPPSLLFARLIIRQGWHDMMMAGVFCHHICSWRDLYGCVFSTCGPSGRVAFGPGKYYGGFSQRADTGG